MEGTFARIAQNYVRNVDTVRMLALMFSPAGHQVLIPQVLNSVKVITEVVGTHEQAVAISKMGDLLNQLPQEQATSNNEAPVDLEGLASSPTLVRAAQQLDVFYRSGGVLSRAALVMLVSFFEFLVADLLHQYYKTHREALSSDDPTISVNELKRFKDIEEIFEHLASQKVEAVLRGDLDAWEKLFERQLRVQLKKAVPHNWNQFVEIFQRRNLIVHTNGRVNSLYLKKAGGYYHQSGRPEPQIGDVLDVDEAYLTHAIEIFTMAGVILADLVWSRLEKGEGVQRDELLMGVVVRAVENHQWSLVQEVCFHAIDRAQSRENQMVFQINYWFASKRRGRWPEVASEIDQVDVEGLDSTTQALCVMALKGNEDGFYTILPKAVESTGGDMEFLNWPIFEELTNTPRFEQELSRLRGDIPD